MKAMMKLAALGAATLAMSACSTITFKDGDAMASKEVGSWHHNVAYSLYELSPPVNPGETCGGGWTHVTVEKDVITAIAGSIDSAVIAGVDLWDPWAVTVGCK